MASLNDEPGAKQWPHAPVHRLTSDGVYMVTAATLHKEHLFKASERLTLLENSLFSFSYKYGWQLEAWAVFSNHTTLSREASRPRPTWENFLNICTQTQPVS